jgi:hypothetical protein
VSEITFYIGDLVEHESDRAVLRETARVLEELGRPAVVMANIELGRQIDLVVALDDRALVIEAKGNRTAVRGSVNGTEWQVLASSGKWKPFRNPLQQLAQASFALRDKLRTFVGSEVPYSREALIFCPAIPPNSDIPIGDFKAAIGGLSDLGRLLATPGKLRLPLDRWHAFAQHLQLTRVSNVEVACDERLISAEMLILEYLSAFRETYAPASEELTVCFSGDHRAAARHSQPVVPVWSRSRTGAFQSSYMAGISRERSAQPSTARWPCWVQARSGIC